MSETATFLAQAVVIVGGPYLLWRNLGICSFVPLVVMQILCGMLLGPSGLGLLLPGLWHGLFSMTSMSAMSGLAWLAVVLFSFLSGLHLDVDQLRRSRGGIMLVGIGSASVPIALGTLAGAAIVVLYPGEVGPRTSNWQFALAIGVCLGITALPVLAAILREMGLIDSRLGGQALTCAAIVDALMQVLLVLLVVTLKRCPGPLEMLALPALGALYLAGLVFVVHPLLTRWLRSDGPLEETETVLVIGIAILSAFVTDVMGFHYVIGAFAAGAIMPARVRQAILDRLEMVILVALLPFFFMLAGLKTSVSVASPAFLVMFPIVFFAAVIGKIVGTALPARWLGEDWLHALRLGILMQSKGLMEVVVLTVLFDVGVIRTDVFAVLLLMALLTTAMTKPLLLMTKAMQGGTRRRASAVTIASRHDAAAVAGDINRLDPLQIGGKHNREDLFRQCAVDVSAMR